MLAMIQATQLPALADAGPLVVVGVAALWALVRARAPCAGADAADPLWTNRVIALGNFGSFAIGAVMMSVAGFLADLPAGRDGPRSRRRSAPRWPPCRSAGQRQACFGRPADAAHQLPRQRHAGRRLCWCWAAPFPGPHDATEQLCRLGRAGCPGRRHRHGLLQHDSTWSRCRARRRLRERGAATASNLFMRIVGQADRRRRVRRAGEYRHRPRRGPCRRGRRTLMRPGLRQALGPAELAALTEAVAATLRNVYIVAALGGLIVLFLGLRCRRASARRRCPTARPRAAR